jgi:hypothetical protein
VLRAFSDTDPWVQLSVLLSDDYDDGRIIDWIREASPLADAERIAPHTECRAGRDLVAAAGPDPCERPHRFNAPGGE